MKGVDSSPNSDRKFALLVSAIGALTGGLCCLAPIVMVSLGITTVTIANSWGNLLYGEYKWEFRFAGLLLMAVTVVLYLRSRGVCTLDQFKRQRNRLINLVLMAGLGFTAAYVFWTYVVLHYWGIWAGLPWAQWDESWAIPASMLLAAVTALVFWLLPKVIAGRQNSGEGSRQSTAAQPSSR
jgi:hypothetical protein